jgi:sulfite reductase beta subunit-like hemoprotein
MKKRCLRRVFVPLPPRGLLRKLAPDQVTDLALVHLTNLDLISRGLADEAVLWQMVGGVLTWSRAADLLGVGVDEMRAQLELVTRVVERYGRTGRVGFSGIEYQVAKLGVEVMDQLAEMVDAPTAVAAAEWGEARVNALAAGHQQRCAA